MQEFLHEAGIEGYGLFWLCCELVAQQGVDYQLKPNKSWKKALSYISRLDEKEVSRYLFFMASAGLIDSGALENGSLFIPNMADYSDDYTKKQHRKSVQGTDSVRTKSEKVPLDKIREDKNIGGKPPKKKL